jgi:hypothetical protein
MNINNDSKRYENMKTINQEIVRDNKDNRSFFFKIQKSIKHKEHLLNLAQGRSHKFMEKQKAEMRTLNFARNKRHQKNKYIDLSSIFNINRSSSKGKKDSEKKKDVILDNIINSINKNSKYERLLSSYLIKNNDNNSIKENESEENKEKNEVDKNEDIFNNLSKEKEKEKRKKENKSNYNKSKINTISNSKEIKYPLIRPKIFRSIYNNNDSSNNIQKSRNNIYILNSLNSMEDLSKSRSSRKSYIKTNKSSNNAYNTYKKPNNMILLNRYNSNSIKSIFNKNDEIFTTNLPSIKSYNDKGKVHYFDLLILDKFNREYFNQKLKTLEK